MTKAIKYYRNEELAHEYRKHQRAQNYAKSEKHATNKGEPYSQSDCDAIVAHSICDFELSKQLGRSVRAIQIKRSKLKQER